MQCITQITIHTEFISARKCFMIGCCSVAMLSSMVNWLDKHSQGIVICGSDLVNGLFSFSVMLSDECVVNNWL